MSSFPSDLVFIVSCYLTSATDLRSYSLVNKRFYHLTLGECTQYLNQYTLKQQYTKDNVNDALSRFCTHSGTDTKAQLENYFRGSKLVGLFLTQSMIVGIPRPPHTPTICTIENYLPNQKRHGKYTIFHVKLARFWIDPYALQFFREAIAEHNRTATNPQSHLPHSYNDATNDKRFPMRIDQHVDQHSPEELLLKFAYVGERGYYFNDKKQGVSSTYDSEGRLLCSRNWMNGKAEGEVRKHYYAQAGASEAREYFVLGHLMKSESWNAEGIMIDFQLFQPVRVGVDWGRIRIFERAWRDDGRPKLWREKIPNYDSRGGRLDITYNPDGTVKSKEQYGANGKLIESEHWPSYAMQNFLESRCYFREGLKWKEETWYVNGVMRSLMIEDPKKKKTHLYRAWDGEGQERAQGNLISNLLINMIASPGSSDHDRDDHALESSCLLS